MRHLRTLAVVGTLQDEEGQTLTEYALILGFLSVTAVLILTALGNSAASLLTSVAQTF
jgi:Flp pilus assembly pilin Flp